MLITNLFEFSYLLDICANDKMQSSLISLKMYTTTYYIHFIK